MQPETPVTAGAELMVSLKALDRKLASDVRVWILDALKKFKDMVPMSQSVDEWSARVQAFYEGTQALLTDDNQQNIGRSPVSKEQLQSLMEQVERFVMRRIYASVFCPADSSDRDDDHSLLLRTRSLRWITAHHLDACIVEGDANVRESLEAAYADLWHMSSCKSPVDKLECIIRCSRRVFEALHRSRQLMGLSEETLASADDFIPALIYVIIRSGLPQLQSNINYVARFANPSYLNNGERGYYYTSLCCATDFIKKLDADSLNLPCQEFDGYMSGNITTTASGLATDAFACDGLRLIHENLCLMGELRQRQQRLRARTDNLRGAVTAFHSRVQQEKLLPLPERSSHDAAPSDQETEDANGAT